ncbi:MAG: DUF6680 family protein [Candidatus Omnitrophota bacterium]|jgi:hypothetical protein
MTASDIVSIIAIIVSIIVSPIVAVTIGELLRKRNFEKQKRLEILYDLIAYRDKVESKEFLRSLNSLKLFFTRDNDLRGMLDNLHATYREMDQRKIDPEKVNGLMVKIIKYVCGLEGFKNITEEDIKKLFKIR